MPQRLVPAPPAFNRRKILIHTAAAGALAASVGVPRWARAQSGPMRIVVGYPPGGGTDRAARLVADRLQQLLKRTVVVENRVGAGGRLAAQQLVNTPPDQTVLLLANPAVMSVSPLIYKDLKYDVQKDYVPVAAVTDYDFGVAVGSALPVKEVQHMLAWIRANPTKANAGVPGTGSLPHFFSLMLSYMAQVNIEVVGYRGSAPLITDLIGGQVAADPRDAIAVNQHVERAVADGTDRLQDVPREPGAKRAAGRARVMHEVGQRVAEALANPEVPLLLDDGDHAFRFNVILREDPLDLGVPSDDLPSRLLVVGQPVALQDRLDRVRECRMPDVVEKRGDGGMERGDRRDAVQGAERQGRGAHALGVVAARERVERGRLRLLSSAERNHQGGNAERSPLESELADSFEAGKRERGAKGAENLGVFGPEFPDVADRRRGRGNDAERVPLDGKIGRGLVCHCSTSMPHYRQASRRSKWPCG